MGDNFRAAPNRTDLWECGWLYESCEDENGESYGEIYGIGHGASEALATAAAIGACKDQASETPCNLVGDGELDYCEGPEIKSEETASTASLQYRAVFEIWCANGKKITTVTVMSDAAEATQVVRRAGCRRAKKTCGGVCSCRLRVTTVEAESPAAK